MKIPEKAPEWTKLNAEEISVFPELSECFKKANRDYIYWDRFKYIVPDKAHAGGAWKLLRTFRALNMKRLPLENKAGNSFRYWLPDCALEYLHEIDQDAGGFISAESPFVYSSEKKRYLVQSIVEEAIASSQIEGAVTTRKVAKEMFDSGRKPKDRSEQMIYNNFLTIEPLAKLLN